MLISNVKWLDGMTESMDRNLGKLGEIVRERGLVCCSPRGCKESSDGILQARTLEWVAISFSSVIGG